MSARVLALVGTDHHRFDRLVDWIDDAARLRPDVSFLVQHGASRAPVVAEGRDFVPHALLSELLAGADAVVCHGGPGTIMDARAAGHVPICVPREPRLREHVDDHQVRFARTVGAVGVVVSVRDHADFAAALDQALSGMGSRGPGFADTEPTRLARELLARELDALALGGTGRGVRRGGRRGRRTVGQPDLLPRSSSESSSSSRRQAYRPAR